MWTTNETDENWTTNETDEMWTTNETDENWPTNKVQKFPLIFLMGIDIEKCTFLMGIDKTIDDNGQFDVIYDTVKNSCYYFNKYFHGNTIDIPLNPGVYTFIGTAYLNDVTEWVYEGEFRIANMEDFKMLK